MQQPAGPGIVVREAEPAPPGFDARHSATARRYRYLVVNAPVADPLLAGLAWHVADPLDLRSMAAASDAVLGEHDFRAFCRRVPGTGRRADQPPGARRPLDPLRPPTGPADRASDPGRPSAPGVPGAGGGDLLAFEIEANAFCHQMVRSLVGTLVDVGRGRKRPSDMLWILRSADREQASQPAPPHGLTLTAVRYPADRGLPGRAHWSNVVGRRVGPAGRERWSPAPAAPTPEGPPRGAQTPGTTEQGTPLRTFSPKPDDITRAWHIVDADGLVLGRLATEVASILRGKHKPTFVPHVDTGDHVIVVNADKVAPTSGKAESKIVLPP